MTPRSKTRSALLCAFFPLVAVAVIVATYGGSQVLAAAAAVWTVLFPVLGSVLRFLLGLAACCGVYLAILDITDEPGSGERDSLPPCPPVAALAVLVAIGFGPPLLSLGFLIGLGAYYVVRLEIKKPSLFWLAFLTLLGLSGFAMGLQAARHSEAREPASVSADWQYRPGMSTAEEDAVDRRLVEAAADRRGRLGESRLALQILVQAEDVPDASQEPERFEAVFSSGNHPVSVFCQHKEGKIVASVRPGVKSSELIRAAALRLCVKRKSEY